LLVTASKVFLYDLSTLDSGYRIGSLIALGLLLLVGAYAHQRLRPPPAPLEHAHPGDRYSTTIQPEQVSHIQVHVQD
jgi:uncharacterized membrane protein